MKKFLKRSKDKYLTKEQQIRRGFLKGLAISVLLLAITIVLYQLVIVPQAIQREKNNMLATAQKNKVVGYKLNKDLAQGMIVTSKDIELVSFSRDSVPEDVVSSEISIVDKVMRVSLKKNAIITASLITPNEYVVTADLRKQDYSHIILNKNLAANQYVDIRIKMRDGQDFIVASKKKVFGIEGSTIFLQITELERTYINNATVKAANTEGALLYTTIYVDPENQLKAPVDYVPDHNIMAQILANEKLVQQAQQALIQRNTQSSGTDQSANGTQSNDTANYNDVSNANRSDRLEGGQ